jgi:hypothetical protein
MCKRTKFIGTGDIHTNVTFKMLETDFILEKAMLYKYSFLSRIFRKKLWKNKVRKLKHFVKNI